MQFNGGRAESHAIHSIYVKYLIVTRLWEVVESGEIPFVYAPKKVLFLSLQIDFQRRFLLWRVKLQVPHKFFSLR